MSRRPKQAMFCLPALYLLYAVSTTVPVAEARPENAALARLFALARQRHVAAGCKPWTRDPRLDRAAQLHASEIARMQRVSHVGRDGATVRERLRRQGFAAVWASESIALYPTPEASVQFWSGEPPGGPHRQNLTSCQYTHAGVGVAYDGRGIPWWVMDYANRDEGN
jgi:uncharacterized protein YkwD